MAIKREGQGEFLRERIVAVDGMAATADVWNQAHDDHRQYNEALLRSMHGPGILSGLKVLANNQLSKRQIHIEAGIAVDPWGRIIVHPEASPFDLRDQQGLLYLVLTYKEGGPYQKADDSGDDAPHYVQLGWEVVAVTTLPSSPYVELARILRQDLNQEIKNALDTNHPGPHEIDLRFRRTIRTNFQDTLAVACIALERNLPGQHWGGWDNLARELSNRQAPALCIDRNITLPANLNQYGLVCLAAQNRFSLTDSEKRSLRDYLRRGGVIYYESCRRGLRGEPSADDSFVDLLKALKNDTSPGEPAPSGVFGTLQASVERAFFDSGGKLPDVPQEHTLYVTPNFFAQWPDGYELRGQPQVHLLTGIGQGTVIMSKNDYACVWAGDRRDRRALRSELRDAFDWGQNLVTFTCQQIKKL